MEPHDGHDPQRGTVFRWTKKFMHSKAHAEGFWVWGQGSLFFFWMVKGTTCMLHSTFNYSIQGCFQGSFCMLVNLARHHAIGQFVLIIEGELFTSAELFRFPKSAPKPAHGSKGLASCQEAWYSLGLGDPQTSVLTLFSDFDQNHWKLYWTPSNTLRIRPYPIHPLTVGPQSDQSKFAKNAVKHLTKQAGGTLSWDLEDEESRTPLMLAALHNNEFLVKHLVKKVKVDMGSLHCVRIWSGLQEMFGNGKRKRECKWKREQPFWDMEMVKAVKWCKRSSGSKSKSSIFNVSIMKSLRSTFWLFPKETEGTEDSASGIASWTSIILQQTKSWLTPGPTSTCDEQFPNTKAHSLSWSLPKVVCCQSNQSK